MYYRDAVAAIICYDLTNEHSFKSLDYWTNEMQEKNNVSDYFLAISGNKCDTDENEWQITSDMVSELKGKIGLEDRCIFTQTSAKTGSGVNQMF